MLKPSFLPFGDDGTHLFSLGFNSPLLAQPGARWGEAPWGGPAGETVSLTALCFLLANCLGAVPPDLRKVPSENVGNSLSQIINTKFKF